MMRLDFLIFYEHASRELENACYLAAILTKRGYKVKIINIRYLWRIFLNPKVVITPYLYGDEDVHEFTGFINGRSRAIINLQYEQIYNDARLASDFSKPTELSAQATHICWGAATKERLSQCGVSSINLPVTGAISMDFNLPELSPFLKTKEQLSGEFNIDNSKPWHLFISSFVYSSLSDSAIDGIEKKIPGYGPFVEIARKSQNQVIEWIKSMALKHSDKVFIYRPHPNEFGTQIVTELEHSSDNIYVIPNYSIRQWVAVCEISSNWFSTSIADCFFARRPCCVLRPIEIPSNFEIKILEGCKFTSSLVEYDNFLSSGNPDLCPMEMTAFSGYYLTDTSRLFGERVADACEQVLHGGVFPFKRSWKDCFTSVKYDALAAFFRLFPKLGSNPKSRFYDFHRMAENTRNDKQLLIQYTSRFNALWNDGR